MALLVVVGLQVRERSETARLASEELARTKGLATLAEAQAINVLPDLAALRLRMLAEGETSFLTELVIGGFWELYSGEFLVADEARTQLDLAAAGLDIEGGAEAFDRQRQAAEGLLEALAGERELSEELVVEAQAARIEADLTFARMANSSTSNAWITYIGAIDAARSTVVEFSYVSTTLIGLDVIDEDALAELGGVRANATQRVVMGLDQDLQQRVQDVLDSPANAEWERAVADARQVAAGRADPWPILDVGALTGPSQQLAFDIAEITDEAVGRVQAELVDVERSAIRERRTLLWTTGLLLAVTVTMTVLILQSVLTPLRRLAKRAGDLAEGTIDGERIDHGDHDAIAELGNTIEDVADGLRHLGQQFEAMAEGDLDDPSLQLAAPGLVGAFVQDWVQEVREASGTLKAEATQDQLTGLLNRRGLADHLNLMAGGPEIAVVYLDLDKFKAVNDVHGHRHGDAVLKVVARRLLGFVREEDPVCRLGGDEFVLLVTGVERQDMPIFTSRLEIGLSEPISFEGTVHNIGCSIGVGWLGPGDLLEPILEEADKRMLDAKANRPDRIPR